MSKTTRLLRLLRLSPKRPGSTGRGWALAPLPAVFAGEDWGGREEEKGEGRREGGGQRRGREKPKGGGEEEGEGRRGRKRTGGRREQGRENREEGGGSTGGRSVGRHGRRKGGIRKEQLLQARPAAKRFACVLSLNQENSPPRLVLILFESRGN